MFTRAAVLLVLLAALLQAAPMSSTAGSIRVSAAVVSVRSERQHQRQLRGKLVRTRSPRVIARLPQDPPPAFSGFATAHFQRPPPARG